MFIKVYYSLKVKDCLLLLAVTGGS